MYTQVRGFGFDYKGAGKEVWYAREEKKTGRKRVCSPFGDFSCFGGEKGSFVVMNDTKIYYVMRGRRKEKLT